MKAFQSGRGIAGVPVIACNIMQPLKGMDWQANLLKKIATGYPWIKNQNIEFIKCDFHLRTNGDEVC